MSETESPYARVPRASTDIRVVESFFRALEALDLERALEHLDPRVVYQNYPFPPDRGLDEVRRTLGLFARVTDAFEVRMIAIAERDGVVLTERTDVIRGPGLDLKFWVCGTFEVRDGKIVLWRDRFDTGAVALQLLTSPARWLLGAPRRGRALQREPRATRLTTA